MGVPTEDKARAASDRYIPPPMDPYATYQTPYERRPSNDQNPFIEFRRFADKQFSSLFENFGDFPNFSRMFGISDEMQRMREHSDKFKEDLERQIEDLAEQREKMMRDFWKERREIARRAETEAASSARELNEHLQTVINQSSQALLEAQQMANRAVDTSVPSGTVSNLPAGWIEASTRDGKSYYIEQATGRALPERPCSEADSIPAGWEARKSEDGRTYFIDHNTRNTTWDDSRMQDSMDQEDISAEDDRRERWRRGFQNCPALKQTSDETELDMYELLEEQRNQEDLWSRGFQNCPDLAVNGEKKRSLIEAAIQQENHKDEWRKVWRRHATECPGLAEMSSANKSDLAAYLSAEQAKTSLTCPWKNEKRSWSWLPTLGHDGMQRARRITLREEPDDADESSGEAIPTKYLKSDTAHMDPFTRDDHLFPWLWLSPYSPFLIGRRVTPLSATGFDGHDRPVQMNARLWSEDDHEDFEGFDHGIPTIRNSFLLEPFEDLLSLSRTGEMVDRSDLNEQARHHRSTWPHEAAKCGILGPDWKVVGAHRVQYTTPQSPTRLLYSLATRYGLDDLTQGLDDAHLEQDRNTNALVRKWDASLDGDVNVAGIDLWSLAQALLTRRLYEVGLRQSQVPWNTETESASHAESGYASNLNSDAKPLPIENADDEEEDSLDRSWSTSFTSSSSSSSWPPSESEIPSIVSTMTTTTRRAKSDGTFESSTILKKRFSDGSEVTEQWSDPQDKSTKSEKDIDSPAFGQAETRTVPQRKSGWFWNS